MTLTQITNKLVEIAEAHKMVATARHLKAEDFLVYNYKDNQYPAVWFTLNNSRIDGKAKVFRYVVTVADMHHPENMNDLEVQSDMEQIASDLIAHFSWDKHEWTFTRQTEFEYFREDQEDILAGVTFAVELRLPYTYNNCQVPTDYELPNGNFVYINTNRFMSIADFIVGPGQPMEQGAETYTNAAMSVTPFVFIDGMLQTYNVRSDRRYVSYNSTTKTITIHGGVNEGENIRIVI